jgi:hypothetical protein
MTELIMLPLIFFGIITASVLKKPKKQYSLEEYLFANVLAPGHKIKIRRKEIR